MAKRVKFAVDTKVPVISTRAEIEHELTKYGATSFAFAMHDGEAIVMFEYDGRRVRFDLPLPVDRDDRSTAKLHRAKWRALLLSIKAKLVSVDTEIETFEEAFLAHVVLANGERVADAIRPAIAQQYATGKFVPLLGGPSK